MLPTKLLQRLGGFDEEFGDYGIDTDLTTRVLLAGYKVVYTKCVAIHHYRNYEADSWITGGARDQHLESARELYRRKYHELITSRSGFGAFPKLPYSFVDNYYVGVLRLIVKASRSERLSQWAESHIRDWSNVAKGRFISRWDLIRNIFKPYYLIQEIPVSVRERVKMGASANQSSRIKVL
jgi:GT2 family glycosyltransferase